MHRCSTCPRTPNLNHSQHHIWRPLALTEVTGSIFDALVCALLWPVPSFSHCAKNWVMGWTKKCQVHNNQLGLNHGRCGNRSLIKGNVSDSNSCNPDLITAFITIPHQIAGIAPPVVGMTTPAVRLLHAHFRLHSQVHMPIPHLQVQAPTLLLLPSCSTYLSSPWFCHTHFIVWCGRLELCCSCGLANCHVLVR